MARPDSKKTLSFVLADAQLKVSAGTVWPLLVTKIPRPRSSAQAPPCDFCGATPNQTPTGWHCPACDTEMRTL